MSIKVTIPAGENDVTIDPLHQWDYGQILEIESLDFVSECAEVHFSSLGLTEAIVESCSVSSSRYTVRIPDSCLETGDDVTAWIYEIDGSNGKTTKKITIPVIARPRPSWAGE